MNRFWLSLCAAAWLGAQTPTSWTPELSLQVKGVTAVVPSPDGQLAAWTESRFLIEAEKSESNTQIFLGKADGSHRRQLTRGEKSCDSPAFSPDGRWVFFKSSRSGKPNVWRIPVDGGEAEMLTDSKGTTGNYAVSPDGKWLAVTVYEPPAEREKARREKRDVRVVDADPESQALYVVSVEGKRDLRKLSKDGDHVTSLAWSPDSRHIAFAHQPDPLADFWTRSDLSEVEVESGAIRALAATGAAEREPAYSPDGRWVAFLRSSDPPRWPGQERVALLARPAGPVRDLAPTYDERPDLLGWAADSTRLFLLESRRSRRVIYALPVDGPPVELYAPAQGIVAAGSVNTRGTHLGFAAETCTEPVEAFLMPASGGAPVRVSRANVDLPRLPLGKTEIIRWKARDGMEIEGLLTYPVGYEAGRKYPLILNIHGGPAGVFSESFLARPGIYPLAAFAARGWGILRCNIRGSGGYGRQFRFANVADWGGKDYEDLMAGVDHVIGLGVADPDRLAVMGWSYGGFMTSWVIGQTTRFKAAVIGAAVTNLWSFTGTTDIAGFLPDYLNGEPWDNFERYRRHSPLSHVRNVTTPALILHGESDLRVPLSQGYEYYSALKRRGVTTKMVTYPRMPHGPNEPKFMLDIMQRHIDWVEKYVP